MQSLSNIKPCDKDLTKLLNYLLSSSDDEPFVLKQIYEDQPYYLQQDKNGYKAISLQMRKPLVLKEEITENGYTKIRINRKSPRKHRLIYKLYGKIPDYVDFDNMEVHHINLDKQDNRLENLYLISKINHRILHKYIDKYGIENVEI